jgi:6-pyruvoyl-tetrahydropterin synthase related domain
LSTPLLQDSVVVATDEDENNFFGPLPRLFPRPFLVIAATAFGVVFPFFLLGVLAGHDFAFHMNSWMEVAAQWKQGIIYPRWAAMSNYGYGEPRFIFYPPSSWMLGALLGTVLPWKLVSGAFIWIALTLSGCSMFCLARNWLTRRDAIFAAALYATNPYYLVIVYWRSDFAELLAAALFPLLLLFLLQAHERRHRALILLSLIVAVAWLTNAPAAVMVNYSLVLLSIVVAIFWRSLRPACIGLGSLLLGLGLAAFYVVPAACEQKWVSIGQVLANGFRPHDNFLFTAIGDAGHDAFNRMLTFVAIFEVFIVALASLFVRHRRTLTISPFLSLFIWGVAASLLMFSLTLPLWTILPKLQFLQFPWRWLLCLNVVFAIFVSSAWPSKGVRTALYFAIIGMLFYAAWRIQRPWKDTGAQITEMAERFKTGEGYKSRPEYLPITASPTSVNPLAAAASFLGEGETNVEVNKAESKVISVHARTAGTVHFRTFTYPAWAAMVNGAYTQVEMHAPDGTISVRVPGGESRIQLRFIRTPDRLWGGIVSTVTAAFFLLYAFLAPKSPITTKEEKRAF